MPPSSALFRFNAWYGSSLLIALIVSLPLLSIVYIAFSPNENIWGHLVDTVLPFYVQNTLTLMAGVFLLTLVIGVSSAWVIAMYQFPGKSLLSWALLLPFAVPAYVVAYVYTDLLEYAGPVQTALRSLFGWESARDYWFPEIRSMGGAILMMSLALYPYVYMLARTAFLEQSQNLYHAARSLGAKPHQLFLRVALPVARPAIAVGVALALMETLNDFGTVDYFAVQTLSAGLYDTWLNMSNLGGAAQIACVMVLFVIVLITLERYSRRKQKQYLPKHSTTLPNIKRLHGKQLIFALLITVTPVLLGFIIPAGVLAYYAISYFSESWNSDFFNYVSNSFMLAFSASLMALALGLILSYSKRLNKSRFISSASAFASLGYAMPGAVLAIGVIIPFAGFDNALDSYARETFGFSTGLLLSGTAFAIIFAYVVRFLAIASGSVESSLDRISNNMDMASRSLGHSYSSTLVKVHIPIIKKGVWTAVLVVFVDCLKELPATLILRPFNFETLATHVYQFASDELLEQSALSALVIVLVGIIPIVLLNRTISKN